MSQNIFQQIRMFNDVFGLAVNERPTLYYPTAPELAARLRRFKQILLDEIDEVDEIIADVEAGNADDAELLTAMADWYGDIIVYCASEMVKHGLDPEAVVGIIMSSNMSKLDADGKAIMVDGKVGKGPMYFKPEPEIQRWIEFAMVATNPNTRQVGGSHYKTTDGKPQHWDLAIAYKWDPFQYQVTKYVMRWKHKHSTPEGKLQDLQKAAHFLEKYIANYKEYLPVAGAAPVPRPVEGEDGNAWWTNEGYYGDGTCLYKCRHCKSTTRQQGNPATPCPCTPVVQINAA